MKKKILVAGVAATLIMLLGVRFFEIFAFHDFINFIEKNISPDQNIDCYSCAYVRVYSLVVTVFITCAALLVLDYRIVLWKLKQLKNSKLNMHIRALILLALIFLLLYALLSRTTNLYIEDGIFEWLTMIFSVLAAIMILIKLVKQGTKNQKFLLILALVFIIFGMEEISWGQRIFGWNTPEILSEYNYQGETNLHNLFNPIIDPIYAFVYFLLGWTLLNIDRVEDILSRTKWFHYIAPYLPPSEFNIFGVIFYFIGMLVTIDFFAPIQANEISEEILSIFILAYSIELYKNKT